MARPVSRRGGAMGMRGVRMLCAAVLLASAAAAALAGPTPAAGRPPVAPTAAAVGDAAQGPSGPVHRAVGVAAPLTGPSEWAAERVVRDYLRHHRDRFGLDDAHLAGLEMVEHSVSPDGIRHLSWIRRADGLPVDGAAVRAHVDRRGRVLALEVATPDPAPAAGLSAATLGAGEALARARRAVGGVARPDRIRSDGGRRRTTHFSGGERAEPVALRRAGGLRPGWRMEVADAAGGRHSVVVDGRDGRIVRSVPLSSRATANVTALAPGEAPGGVATPRDIDPPGAGWLSDHAGHSRLAGDFAHVYADLNGDDIAGPGEDIPSGGGGNWIFLRVPFPAVPGAPPCPVAGCAWVPAVPATAATNRSQRAANLFFHVNAFHDHLRDSAIGFTAASGAFEGAERLIVEFDDPAGRNNARMTTPPRGRSPRLELFLWDAPAISPADDATVILHEYAHGVVARLVGGPDVAGGLSGAQGAAMAEGFSDWLALDHLAGSGAMVDHPGAPGDIVIGRHVAPPYGVRRQAIDCRVADVDALRCPGPPGRPPGGLTFADIARLDTEHDRGEFWAQLLWDLRRAVAEADGGDPAAPSPAALEEVRAMVAGALRMAPVGADMVDVRDALLAHVVAVRPDRYRLVWEVMARRGLGAAARSGGSDGVEVEQSFALPEGLWMGDVWLDENRDMGGDGDGMTRPGETFSIRPELINAGMAATGPLEGVLTSATPGVVVRADRARWPALASPWGRALPETDLSITAPEHCAAQDLAMHLRVSGAGVAQGLDFVVPVRPRRRHDGAPGPGTQTTSAIPGGGASLAQQLAVPLGGAVPHLRVRLDHLSHPRPADLVVRLEHVPSGVGVVLLDRPAISAADLRGVIFDDLADRPLGAGPDTPGHAGVWLPHRSLVPMQGRDAAGPWRLVVRDTGTGASGQLHAWGISVEPPDCGPAPAAPSEAPPLQQATPAAVSGPVSATELRVVPTPVPVRPVVRFTLTARRLVLPARRGTRLRVSVAARTRVTHRVRVTIPARRTARGVRIPARRVLLVSGRATASARGVAVLPITPTRAARKRLPSTRRTYVAHLEVRVPGGRVFTRRFTLIPQPGG